MDSTIIAAIIAAITSFISSILVLYSIHVTKRGNKENIESNKEISKTVQQAEDMRTKKQIDANTTWKARVEWIQNVRKITAEFVTSIYKYVHSNPYNECEVHKNLEMVQEKKYLLILFFGPNYIRDEEKGAEHICDKRTNVAKNEMIVDLINSIYNYLQKYFHNESLREHYHSNVIDCIKCKSGRQIDCMHSESKEDCIKYKNEQSNLENECIKTKEKLFHDVELLIESMRIYLKIEWEITKNTNTER